MPAMAINRTRSQNGAVRSTLVTHDVLPGVETNIGFDILTAVVDGSF